MTLTRSKCLLPAAMLVLGAQSTAAQSPGLLVSTGWLAENLERPGLVILHVDGRPDGYERNHIPGARFIDIDDLMVDGEPAVGYEMPPVTRIVEVLQAAGVGDDSHVVVYGQTPLAATRTWLTFEYIGLGDRVSVLDGGLIRWQAESRPVTTQTLAVSAGHLTAKPRLNMMVDADWIHARLEDTSVLLLDARPDDEYTGEDGGMGGMTNPGHIPGAYHLYWEKLVVDRQTDPVFLPRSQLSEQFIAAGAGDAGTIVAYCMVGWRASLVYFTGRLLGYEMRFYDGSWHDWGSRDLPFVSGRSRR